MKTTVTANILIMLLCGECLKSQAQLNILKYEIGAGAGVFVYQGDLTPSGLGSYKTLEPAFAIYLNKIITPMFSLRTNLSLGALKGDDSKYAEPAYRKQRNFKFSSPIVEVSELVVANLLKNNSSKRYFGFSPFVFTGIGFSFLNIKRDYSGFNGEYFAGETSTIRGLNEDAQHSLPKLIPVIPVGIGIKYAITQKISINAETTYRLSFTDYIDGFSQAANAARKDSYQSQTVGVIYRFLTNNSVKCPVF
jgi:hypothetical protein